MGLQFIYDSIGNPIGVFIPIEEWQSLKSKYIELQQEEANNIDELASWQKQLIDDRLNDYYTSPTKVADFDSTINDIEKSL